MLVDFSYHLQIHDWGWISFYLKEENAWDIILELTKVDFFLDFFFLKYCISRDIMLALILESIWTWNNFWFQVET